MMALLTPMERKQLLTDLDNRKDKLQLLSVHLFKCLDKQKPFPDNEELTLRIYKTTASPKALDLLRSDLRHIAAAIEKILAQKEFQDTKNYQSTVHASYQLCLAFIAREEFDLFKAEIEAILDKMAANEDFANYILFYNLYKEHSNRTEATTKDNYEKLYYELIDTEQIVIKNFLQQWHIHQTRRSFALSNVWIYNPTFEPVASMTFDELEARYPFSMLDFLKAKAETYSGTIMERKQALIEVHSRLQRISTNHPNLAQERLTNAVNLFTLHCITGEPDQGFVLADEVLGLIAIHRFDRKLLHTFYFNLCSMKLRYGYIEEGIALIDEYAEQFYTSAYGTRFRFLRVYQFIFEGKTELAYENIPSDFSASPDDNLYIKIIETIIFFLRGDIELVLFNIKNIRQNSDYNKFSNPTYEFFARSLLAIVNSWNKKEKKIIADELAAYYAEQIQTPNPFLLPIVWLGHYLKLQSI
jgi:hypothetical protein